MIGRETLEGFFQNTRKLRDEDRAPFDIDDVCRWSYFLIDTDKEKLTQAGRKLENDGYEIYGFIESTPDDNDQITIYLRFDKIEKHTVDSLFARNLEFYALAEKFDLKNYDGMDVGAVDGP